MDDASHEIATKHAELRDTSPRVDSKLSHRDAA